MATTRVLNRWWRPGVPPEYALFSSVTCVIVMVPVLAVVYGCHPLLQGITVSCVPIGQ